MEYKPTHVCVYVCVCVSVRVRLEIEGNSPIISHNYTYPVQSLSLRVICRKQNANRKPFWKDCVLHMHEVLRKRVMYTCNTNGDLGPN